MTKYDFEIQSHNDKINFNSGWNHPNYGWQSSDLKWHITTANETIYHMNFEWINKNSEYDIRTQFDQIFH